MPKIIFIDINLREDEPDRCLDCPLLGLIPKDEREFGRQQSHVCLGTRESLSERMIKARRTDKDDKHKLDRPCTRAGLWQVWQEKEVKPGIMVVRAVDYNKYRLGYVQSGQMPIKFRKPREKKQGGTMYRCGQCIWFASKKLKRGMSFKGKCVVTDEDKDMLTRRCDDNFEKREQ
jgi:hypothetical protein